MEFKALQKRAIRAVNNSSFKAHTDPIFFRLELLNFDDTYKLGVLSFMHKYFYGNLPTSFHDMFNSLAEPNRTKSYYKLKRVHLNSRMFSLRFISKNMKFDLIRAQRN